MTMTFLTETDQASTFPPRFPNPPVCSLLLRDNGRNLDDLTPLDSFQPLFRVQYSTNPFGSKPDVAILDMATNTVVGTVRLHIFTAKTSVTLSTPNVSSSFAYRKKFHSSAPGVGDLTWSFVGRDSHFNLQLTDGDGEVIATYAGNGDVTRAEKRLDIWRAGMSPALMDEVIVTLVAQIERMRKEMEIRFVGEPVGGGANPLTAKLVCVGGGDY